MSYWWRCGAMMALVLMVALASVGCSGSEASASEDEPRPRLVVKDARAGVGESVSHTIHAADLPHGVREVSWLMGKMPGGMGTSAAQLPRGLVTLANYSSDDSGTHSVAVRGEALLSGSLPLAEIVYTPASRIVARQPIPVEGALAVLIDGRVVPLEVETGTVAVSMFSTPIAVATFLCGVVGFVYWLSLLPAMAGFFRYLPPLIWMYFIPMMATTVGITPDVSAFYSPFMSRWMLPAILVLLLIPADVRGIVQLGWKAVAMMLVGTTGIVLGALVSLGIFATLMPDSLPSDMWKGIAALSGSWIGGSANMTAVLESVGTPPGLIGPLIVVDTVLAYSWLGTLIALSAYQERIDKYHKADTTAIEAIAVRLNTEMAANARMPKVSDIAMMLGLAMVVGQVAMAAGSPVYSFLNGIDSGITRAICEVVNAAGWGFLIVTAAGLLLSATPARKLDYCGASSVGYVGLYLLLTTYGARADLRAITEVPIFFAIGVVWLAVHIAVLYIGLRLLRAPLFLAATSSMANIGGPASAPVVAAAYNQSMAPVGLLMAILGGTLGTPLALFVVATAGRAIQGG